jgi:general secretion pathway protein L
METLLIRLATETAAQQVPSIDWQLLDSNLNPMGQAERGPLEKAAGLANGRKVVILAPSEDILLSSIQLPARNRQQLLKAVPYSLEEELAEDVDALHFALGTRQPDQNYPVAVVSRAHMDAWLNAFKEANLTPHAIYPELLSLALADSSWSILIENERAIIRCATFHGFSAETSNLQPLLQLAIEEAGDDAPELINIYHRDRDTHKLLPLDLSVPIIEHFDCPADLMTTGLGSKQNINLLQGSYEASSGTASLLRPWRVAAILLGVWLTLQATSVFLDYWRLDRESDLLKNRIETVFKDTFPQVSRIVNPRVQMEQKLKILLAEQQGGQGDDFMDLLYAASRAINTTPGVEVDVLNFLQGRLELALTAVELRSFEKIKQLLDKDGLNANIESAETVGQKVEARFRIQRSRE